MLVENHPSLIVHELSPGPLAQVHDLLLHRNHGQLCDLPLDFVEFGSGQIDNALPPVLLELTRLKGDLAHDGSIHHTLGSKEGRAGLDPAEIVPIRQDAWAEIDLEILGGVPGRRINNTIHHEMHQQRSVLLHNLILDGIEIVHILAECDPEIFHLLEGLESDGVVGIPSIQFGLLRPGMLCVLPSERIVVLLLQVRL